MNRSTRLSASFRCGPELRAVDEMQTLGDLALPLLNRFYIQRQTTIRRNYHGKYINSS